MLDYTDARPDGERDRYIKQIMDTKLLHSFVYLLDKAEATLHCQYGDTRLRLKDLILQVEPSGGKLRGTVYALHTQLVKAMKAGRADLADELLSYLPLVEYSIDSPRVLPWGTPAFPVAESKAFIQTLSDDYNSTYSREFDASSPSAAEYVEMEAIIRSVLKNLEGEDPETFGEIGALVSDFVVIRSSHINAGTCFKAFGLVYLTVLRCGQEWTTYLENIVHEAAHHHLFALWTIDPIIESDGGRMYPSPIRTEPRPMSGIYHAMFVLARTIRVINLFRDNPKYSKEIKRMSTGYNQAKNTASLEEKFTAAYHTIRSNAKLTSLGDGLLESCRQMALGVNV